MLKVRIIPCLDVKDGRVVKGINFVDLIDAGDPIAQAEYYSKNGADEICFLDISASLENRNTMVNVVKNTAEEVFIPLTVGGGISSIQNIRSLLKAGADKVSINSAAIFGSKADSASIIPGRIVSLGSLIILTISSNDNKINFRASGSVVKFDGFLKVYQVQET